MEKTSNAVQFLSLFLMSMGMVLSLVLTIFALWPDFEAALFDTNNANGEALNSLHCPLIITPADEAVIRLKLNNSSDQSVNFLTRASIAQKSLTFIRQVNARATVQPGEDVEFTWAVSVEDAVYERMILARVRVLRTSRLPTRHKACGILVLNVPLLKGNHIVVGLLAAILLYLGGGAVLWFRHERPLSKFKRDITRVLGLFVLMLLATMIFSLIGWWGSGFTIIVVMFLVIGAGIDRFAS